MDLLNLQANWVDLAILVLLVVGVVRGRKRGMSQEMLDMAKWFLIVMLAAFVYEPGGRMLSQSTMFGLLYSYVAVYALVLLLILATFAFLRHAAGQKLVSSDVFGEAEYYLGMLAGAFRYGCVLLVLMAFLNARYFTPQEIRAQERYQFDNYGSVYFPTLAGVQNQVFEKSLTGRFVKEHLTAVLIRPTAPNDTAASAARSFSRRREKQLNDVLAK